MNAQFDMWPQQDSKLKKQVLNYLPARIKLLARIVNEEINLQLNHIAPSFQQSHPHK